MDFHSMQRKELQRLCKKHDLPANLTNLDMANNLSSFLKVQEKEKPMRRTRSCLKTCDEMLSENESDVLKRNPKKVRFSPQNDVFQLGVKKSERDLVVENKGGAGRVTRGGASLGKKVIISSPVVMKRRGKRPVQEDEKGDLVENRSGASRVTRARASLGEKVLISSPVVMNKRGKRAVQGDEKGDLGFENNGGASRVTRARASLGEKVLLSSPVVMKKRAKGVVQEDEKGELVVENKGGASRVTRARAGKQVLISSPVVMKKRGKRAVQGDEKGDLVVENNGGASRVTRGRAGKQVLISSPVVMKKRAKRAVQEEKTSGNTSVLVVDFTSHAVEERNEVITEIFLRNRKVENVASPKNIVRKRNAQKRSQNISVEVSEKAGRRKITRSRNQFQAKASTVGRESESRDVTEEAKEVVFQVKEPLRRSGRHVNTQNTNFANDRELPVQCDESTRYQTRLGSKRMSVMPQMKKVKMDKPVAGNLGKRNAAVKDFPNESTKPIVLEKGSETGHIRRSKRNASGDDSVVISEGTNGRGSDDKKGTTKKRRRDTILEEVPLQYTGRRVNRKTNNISDKVEEKTPVASEPQTRSGNRQKSFMHSGKKLNVSGNLGPTRTTGEKASPHQSREISVVPKRSATGVRQSKTVAVTPQTRSGSGQKSFMHTAKKLRTSGNLGLNKTIEDKDSPHQSRELSMVPRRSETELKVRGSKSKQTPVIHEHSRRFTRSALKGKTDGPAYVRGKIYQKKSQSIISKLPLSKVESSLPKVILASEGPLHVDVQSSYHEVDRSTVNLVSTASDLPEDKTACSTQGSSAKTSSIDLNVQESEGPELMNILEASPSDSFKLQSNHSEREVDISASEHAPIERPASYDVQASIPQVAGCSTDPISDTSNICSGVDTCLILQDSATEANDKTPVHLKPAEGSDVAGDVASIDGNSVNDGFSSLKQISSKGMEVNPQTITYVEPSSRMVAHAVVEGSTVHEEQSTNPLPFPEDGCSTNPVSETGDVYKVNTTSATLRENSSEANVASPRLVHLKTDNAVGDAYLFDTNALADFSPLDQLTSTRTKERPEVSKDVESISKGLDLNIVFQGPVIHEDQPVYQSPLPEAAGIAENHVSCNSDTPCVTQHEGPTEVNAKSSCMVHLKSVENVDVIEDAGSIDSSSVHDDILNVKQLSLPATKEKQEVSNSINHDLAEGATIDKEELTAEVGDCGPTEQKYDILNHSAEFAESGGLDKDSGNAFKEVSEASSVDLTNETVSMILTEKKDDTMHPEISVQADEPQNTCSKSLDHVFSRPEVSDTVTSTVMCSNKELAEDSNQRLSTVESCLIMEERCTNNRVDFSTLKVVADSVARGDNKSEPKDPSSPSRKTEVDDLVAEVNQVLKSEDSPSLWSSDIIPERVSEDGSSLHKEWSTVITADVSKHDQSKDVKVESEIRPRVSMFDSSTREVSDMPEYVLSSPSHVTEVGDLVAVVNENLKPADISEHDQSKDAKDESEIRHRVSTFDSSISIREASDMPEFVSSLPSHVTEVGGLEVKEKLKPADVSEHDRSKDASGESEIRYRVSLFDSIIRKVSDMPDFVSSSPSPSHVIEVGDVVAEVNEQLTPADVSEHDQSKDAKDESEIRQRASMFDSPIREVSDVPEFISVSQASNFNLGEKCTVNELGAFSICSKKMVAFEGDPELIDKGGEYSAVGSEGREVEAEVFEGTVKNDSDRSMYGDAHHILSSQLPMEEREWDLEVMTCSMSEDVEERRMDKNISIETAQVISEDDVDSKRNPCPMVVPEFPSNVDVHCHTPLEDSCGKEQGTAMSMVKSGRNFGEEFSSQHDHCHRPSSDSCGKEQGTAMSMVKSSKNCGEEFASRHDNIIEQVKVCSDAALPQIICEDFAGFDNQMVADLMGSTARRISRTDALHSEKIEETEPCTVITDKIVLEDGIESLKGNSSNLVQDLVEDSGGYCEKSDADIITCNVSEEDHYGKDTIDSNLQLGGGSLTLTGETGEAQERGHEELSFFSEIFGPELKSRSDEVDGEEPRFWYENTSFMLDKNEDAVKEVDIFTVSLAEEQLHNSGEEHARERGPESIENQHAAFNNPSPGDDNISVENSVGTLSEQHLESEANKDAHQIVDCCNNNKLDEDFTRTGN